MLMPAFEPFQKIARLSRECVITEKIDGTNAAVVVTEAGDIFAQSRTRYVTLKDDNYGFARWVYDHWEDLVKLGPGRHFGEWWGAGIQRKYGIAEKRFSLFNVARWADDAVRPACCHVVPVLFQGLFTQQAVDSSLALLAAEGSKAAPGFMKPEGIVIWHEAARQLFKKTLEKDEAPKSRA